MTSALGFLVVGGTAAGVHLLAFEGFSRQWPAAWPELLNLAAFLVAFGVSFVGHRRLSFKDTSVPLLVSLWRFATTAVAGLVTNEATLMLLHRGLDWPSTLAVGAGIVVAAGQTFVLGRFWAFRR